MRWILFYSDISHTCCLEGAEEGVRQLHVIRVKLPRVEFRPGPQDRKCRSTIRSTKWAVLHDFGVLRRSPRVCKSLKNLKRQDCHGRGRGFEPRRPRHLESIG